MLYYKVGNLLNTTQKVIAHQVNCQGKMSSGVAKAIANKYPEVYEEYWEYCKNTKNCLGKAQGIYIPQINDKQSVDRVIYNLFGQKYYGYDGRKYTSYKALLSALNDMFFSLSYTPFNEAAIPYLMGCDRGGGDWNVVSSIIEELSNEYNIDVYIYSLNGYEKNS